MTTYSLFGYGKMIADSRRMESYVRALKQSIKPNAVAIDIGTGTGIFALLACQLGARKVYAIEPSAVIEVAREMSGENGFSDRIEFIQDVSTQVTLPEKADVIISDLRGILPLFGQHVPSIIDARSRLLKPDGVLIPLSDRLWITIVEAPEIYQPYTIPWENNPYNLNLRAARRFVTNTWQKAAFSPEQCLVSPQCCLTLDYTAIDNPNMSAELTWTVSHPGMGHGLGLWFDATLAEDVDFSNAPGQSESIYGQGFFPWSTPVLLEKGDRISVKIQANLVKGNYVWRWHSQVFSPGDPPSPKVNFQQSTFWGQLLSLKQLQTQAHDL